MAKKNELDQIEGHRKGIETAKLLPCTAIKILKN